MDDNTFWVKIVTIVMITVMFVASCVTLYYIEDRIGPVRPIVSMQYQAK